MKAVQRHERLLFSRHFDAEDSQGAINEGFQVKTPGPEIQIKARTPHTFFCCAATEKSLSVIEAGSKSM